MEITRLVFKGKFPEQKGYLELIWSRVESNLLLRVCDCSTENQLAVLYYMSIEREGLKSKHNSQPDTNKQHTIIVTISFFTCRIIGLDPGSQPDSTTFSSIISPLFSCHSTGSTAVLHQCDAHHLLMGTYSNTKKARQWVPQSTS